MKVIYLASHTARLKYENVIYQDINGKRDIAGDMMDIDLSGYDILIATPPCNYYSRANYRRETSKYAQETKHLLPAIIKKFEKTNKPYLVENVINKVLMKSIIKEHKGYYYEHGRHSYFSNIDIDFKHIKQVNYNVQNTSQNKRQGGSNVNNVIDYFITYVIKGGKGNE